MILVDVYKSLVWLKRLEDSEQQPQCWACLEQKKAVEWWVGQQQMVKRSRCGLNCCMVRLVHGRDDRRELTSTAPFRIGVDDVSFPSPHDKVVPF